MAAFSRRHESKRSAMKIGGIRVDSTLKSDEFVHRHREEIQMFNDKV